MDHVPYTPFGSTRLDLMIQLPEQREEEEDEEDGGDVEGEVVDINSG